MHESGVNSPTVDAQISKIQNDNEYNFAEARGQYLEQELELSREELSRATSGVKGPSGLPDDYEATQTMSDKSETLHGGKQASEDA